MSPRHACGAAPRDPLANTRVRRWVRGLNGRWGMPEIHEDVEACVDAVIERVGRRIVLGLPLGLGKPNPLANALYRRAARDRRIELTILTALTLEPPRWDGELERRLVEPIRERLYGGYPELAYAVDRRRGALPDNVTVREFYMAPGELLGAPRAQQAYVSSNYTHAARDVFAQGVNVLAQLVAPARDVDGARRLSLGCNADLALDLAPMLRAAERPSMILGQVHRGMPFTYGDAAIEPGFFDALLDDPATDFPLFGVPEEPVSPRDHAIGLHAAALVRDGGTLQLGIGSLGTAVTHALCMRHRQPERFVELLREHGALARHGDVIERLGGTDPFEEGLYGASEMFVPGFLELYRAGILSRAVDGDVVLHAAFFLGPRRFYRALRELPEADRRRFSMTSVSFVNRLFGDEARKVQQRRRARFLNSAMKATALGAVSSDALGDGRVVSGVGGQHDFVTMAHTLPGGRSVVMLPSVRTKGGEASSNVVWRYGNVTLPRHLRDLVVTEHGIADLRGRSDHEVVDAMLSVTDARFQDALVEQARAAGKLPADYRVPDAYRRNTPARVRRLAERAGEAFPTFPFGSELSDEEVVLGRALRSLRARAQRDPRSLLRAHPIRTSLRPPKAARPFLERMGLAEPGDLHERWLQRVVLFALGRAGAL